MVVFATNTGHENLHAIEDTTTTGEWPEPPRYFAATTQRLPNAIMVMKHEMAGTQNTLHEIQASRTKLKSFCSSTPAEVPTSRAILLRTVAGSKKKGVPLSYSRFFEKKLIMCRLTSPNLARTVKRKLFMLVLSPSAPFLPLPAARALPPGVITASTNDWRREIRAGTYGSMI